MKTEILFTERQRFNQWWLWVLMLGINAIFIFIFVRQMMIHNTVDTGLLVGLAVNVLLTVLFYFFQLETQINDEGISVRFFPFSFKKYSWEVVSKSFVRNYSPLGEYGGWGLRYGFSGQGKAYNVSGNMGLQLVLSNGDKILIGTNKPEELAKVLKEKELLKE